MQTKHRNFILFSLLIAILVITGCNADASAGLFRQLANAREVVDVRYNQLLGQDPATDDLYFLTDTGIYATAGLTTTTSRILDNKKDKLIRSANYDKIDTILYTINEEPAKVQKYIISTSTKSTPAITHGTITTIISVKVIPNGLIVLTGTNSSGATTYALLDSTLTEVSNLSFKNLDGYGLVGVLQQTGFGSVTASSLVVSFVSGSTYKHYYIPKTAPYDASEINVDNSKRIVNFVESGTNLYLLTSDGMIFKGDSTLLDTAFTEIVDVTETYADQAFGYIITSGTTVHYITKPNNKEQLTVFSIDTTNTNPVATTAVTKGYARLIYNTEIVDALELPSKDLLIATARNGMYRITITTPNSNDDSNGSSTEAEKYFP